MSHCDDICPPPFWPLEVERRGTLTCIILRRSDGCISSSLVLHSHSSSSYDQILKNQIIIWLKNSNILKTSQVIQFSYVFHVITKSQVMTCDGMCKMSNRNPIFQMELVKKKDKSSDTKTNRYIIDKYEIIDEWFQIIQHIIVNKQLIKFCLPF